MSDRNVSGVMTYKWLSVHVVLLVDSSERAVTTHRLDVLEIIVRFPAVNKRLISLPTQQELEKSSRDSYYAIDWTFQVSNTRKVNGCSLLQNVQMVSGGPSYLLASFSGIRRPRREINNSLPSSAGVKNEWRYNPTPLTCLYGADKENLISLFTFYPAVHTGSEAQSNFYSIGKAALPQGLSDRSVQLNTRFSSTHIPTWHYICRRIETYFLNEVRETSNFKRV